MNKTFFVPYKTAVLLREKGFNDMCDYYYAPDKQLYFGVTRVSNKNLDYENNGTIAAPTYHQVLYWLEEKKIRIFAEYCMGWHGFIDNCFEVIPTDSFKSREDALNDAITKTLNTELNKYGK